MLHAPLLIPPSASFWARLADVLLDDGYFQFARGDGPPDLSALRVVVPTFAHAQLLKTTLAARIDGPFIPPRIVTLPGWLDMLPPAPDAAAPAGQGRRLMQLYAELRQHGWLKKLFSARRNTDLLPLAQTLLALSDEITQALLPSIGVAPDAAARRWQQALERFPAPVRHLLSDEAQLVWSVWKTQLDGSDPLAARYLQMMRLAETAQEPLVWVSPTELDPFSQAFLERYGGRQNVLPVLLDWRADAVAGVYGAAWTELIAGDQAHSAPENPVPPNLSLHKAPTLESQAQHGAQTIVDWLAAGKSRIALIAQDRVAARRIRALLERAEVIVADETGWKLSTTRAASALAALLDVVTTRGDTVALLDLLKSPFVFAQHGGKAEQIMAIELALRRGNVRGGWDAISQGLVTMPAARDLVSAIAGQAGLLSGRRTLAQWLLQTRAALDELGMRAALESDAAGSQVMRVMEEIDIDCADVAQQFSFAEWRSLLATQLEAIAFVPPRLDRRVMMMPLNGARLRNFDAVLLVGADADHLPSQPGETLFFANAVRRELGLATRESLQRQQLRDFTELLQSNPEVVLSWQSHKEGEPNAMSPWLARLNLALEQRSLSPLPPHETSLTKRALTASPLSRPAPAAAHLFPQKISASAYNKLVACPYQFFAGKMLSLSALEDLSEMPEKRDYGDWLHRILNRFHERVRDEQVAPGERPALLAQVSEDFFNKILAASPAALGYYARWRKAIPAYLEWAAAREASGWRFEAGEREFSHILQTEAGEVVLHGRIDRIDRNDDGEYAVLDYKTSNAADLKKRLKEGEDQQLAFYGLIAEMPVAGAHLVALDPTKGKIVDVAPESYADWMAALEKHLKVSVVSIKQGAGLPAHGIESVCQYCDVRGLCRKGNW
jgi:ATP-dependent helicase/nuclease subunit B